MTRDCLLLAISSSCSWQRRISWCPRECWSNPRGASRLARSSSARIDRSCCFVASGTSAPVSASWHMVQHPFEYTPRIQEHPRGIGQKSSGVCARSYTLVMWLPVLTLWRSFWLGRNQFTRRCRERYSRFRRSTSSRVSCRSYPTNFRMTELFFSSTWGLSFL